MILVFVAAVFCCCLLGVEGQAASLVMLSNHQARCMDGTLGGYYLQANTTVKGGKTFVIHLQGGGECATLPMCESHLNSSLGSSTFFPPTMNLGFLMTPSQALNPDFYDANHVLMAYCSQDLWSGTVTSPSVQTWNLYFSGHLIFEAVIDDLIANHGLGDATDVILEGDSAGGIGVWVNLDHLAQRLPSARVVGAPIAGFYFYVTDPYNGPDHTQSFLANFSAEGIQTAYNLWDSFVDQDCAEAKQNVDPWACLLANYSFPYISSEAFVFEAQTDEVVLEAHDCIPAPPALCNTPEMAYVAGWSQQMKTALLPLMDPTNLRNGVFNPACFIHTDFFFNEPLLDNMNFAQTFGNFYFNRTEPSGYKLADDCGVFCNPSCTSPCS